MSTTYETAAAVRCERRKDGAKGVHSVNFHAVVLGIRVERDRLFRADEEAPQNIKFRAGTRTREVRKRSRGLVQE